MNRLIFSNNVSEEIDKSVKELQPGGVFVLVDVNSRSFVLPRLQAESQAVANATIIEIKSGDINKTVETASIVWQKLLDGGATRKSLLINIGGGVVTDLGGFAAATFKRGIRFINVPTTLLSAVDASVGGKTGVNLGNFKNQVGVFKNADYVIVSSTFFNTLNSQELYSGYAEMIKHGLLESEKELGQVLRERPDEISPERMLALLKNNVLIKKSIVDRDPEEQGLRKVLNLGHTAGHAFESLAMSRKLPIAHGYAVAYGVVTELVLSSRLLGFPSVDVTKVSTVVRECYPGFTFDCDDYSTLLRFMQADKKNDEASRINFTLLRRVGEPVTDCIVDTEAIKEGFDITRDLLGI